MYLLPPNTTTFFGNGHIMSGRGSCTYYHELVSDAERGQQDIMRRAGGQMDGQQVREGEMEGESEREGERQSEVEKERERNKDGEIGKRGRQRERE